MWLSLEEFRRLMEGVLSIDEVVALSTICDELAASRVLLHFKVLGCTPVVGVELLILYTPLTNLIKPVWIKVRLSPDVSASRFLSLSPGLQGEDVRLSLSSEEVSVTVRFHGHPPSIRELLKRILKAVGLEECVDLNLTYDGFTVVGGER